MTILRARLSSSSLEDVGKLAGKTVGERVAEAYKAAGFSRHKLSQITRLSYSTINDWEKHGVTPELSSLQIVAEATGVSVSDLLGDDAELEGTPNIEAAIAARAEQGSPLSPAVIQRLRGYSAKGGDFNPGLVEMLINDAIASELGRSASRPKDPEARVDEGRGERKVTRLRRKS